MKRAIALLLCALAMPIGAQDNTPHSAFTGTWKGTLVNEPARPNAARVDVVREIGPMPTADHTCTMWKTTYSEGGVVKQVKDYTFCRGAGPDDLYTDEGGGVRLSARWIGDVLVTPFKVGQVLLVVHTRLRGNVLDEEILTVDDQPATTGIVPLTPRTIQRLTFARATS